MLLVPYDPRWQTEFLVESKRLSERFGPICRRIEHAGSTAIPGLTAKPIIDIQISVTSLQPMASYKELLEQLGYTHLPHPDDSFCPFFHLPQSWPHSHHVHVVQFGGEEESRTLAFRDYLRDHPAAANEYVALKRSLAKTFPLSDSEGRRRYAEGKSEFIERIIRQAQAGGYPRVASAQ